MQKTLVENAANLRTTKTRLFKIYKKTIVYWKNIGWYRKICNTLYLFLCMRFISTTLVEEEANTQDVSEQTSPNSIAENCHGIYFLSEEEAKNVSKQFKEEIRRLKKSRNFIFKTKEKLSKHLKGLQDKLIDQIENLSTIENKSDNLQDAELTSFTVVIFILFTCRINEESFLANNASFDELALLLMQETISIYNTYKNDLKLFRSSIKEYLNDKDSGISGKYSSLKDKCYPYLKRKSNDIESSFKASEMSFESLIYYIYYAFVTIKKQRGGDDIEDLKIDWIEKFCIDQNIQYSAILFPIFCCKYDKINPDSERMLDDSECKNLRIFYEIDNLELSNQKGRIPLKLNICSVLFYRFLAKIGGFDDNSVEMNLKDYDLRGDLKTSFGCFQTENCFMSLFSYHEGKFNNVAIRYCDFKKLYKFMVSVDDFYPDMNLEDFQQLKADLKRDYRTFPLFSTIFLKYKCDQQDIFFDKNKEFSHFDFTYICPDKDYLDLETIKYKEQQMREMLEDKWKYIYVYVSKIKLCFSGIANELEIYADQKDDISRVLQEIDDIYCKFVEYSQKEHKFQMNTELKKIQENFQINTQELTDLITEFEKVHKNLNGLIEKLKRKIKYNDHNLENFINLNLELIYKINAVFIRLLQQRKLKLLEIKDIPLENLNEKNPEKIKELKQEVNKEIEKNKSDDSGCISIFLKFLDAKERIENFIENTQNLRNMNDKLCDSAKNNLEYFKKYDWELLRKNIQYFGSWYDKIQDYNLVLCKILIDRASREREIKILKRYQTDVVDEKLQNNIDINLALKSHIFLIKTEEIFLFLFILNTIDINDPNWHISSLSKIDECKNDLNLFKHLIKGVGKFKNNKNEPLEIYFNRPEYILRLSEIFIENNIKVLRSKPIYLNTLGYYFSGFLYKYKIKNKESNFMKFNSKNKSWDINYKKFPSKAAIFFMIHSLALNDLIEIADKRYNILADQNVIDQHELSYLLSKIHNTMAFLSQYQIYVARNNTLDVLDFQDKDENSGFLDFFLQNIREYLDKPGTELIKKYLNEILAFYESDKEKNDTRREERMRRKKKRSARQEHLIRTLETTETSKKIKPDDNKDPRSIVQKSLDLKDCLKKMSDKFNKSENKEDLKSLVLIIKEKYPKFETDLYGKMKSIEKTGYENSKVEIDNLKEFSLNVLFYIRYIKTNDIDKCNKFFEDLGYKKSEIKECKKLT